MPTRLSSPENSPVSDTPTLESTKDADSSSSSELTSLPGDHSRNQTDLPESEAKALAPMTRFDPDYSAEQRYDPINVGRNGNKGLRHGIPDGSWRPLSASQEQNNPTSDQFTNQMGYPVQPYRGQEQCLERQDPAPAEQIMPVTYGINCRNGEFTRLVRLDSIDKGPHARQVGPEGLVILPDLDAYAPRGNIPANLDHLYNPGRTVKPPVVVNKNNAEIVQKHIDSVVANQLNPRQHPRREKLFCDKWIHTGTCQFMQQGCKYLHVMPEDRLTQKSLGLNGFPDWWKQENAIGIRAPSPPETPPTRALAYQPITRHLGTHNPNANPHGPYALPTPPQGTDHYDRPANNTERQPFWRTQPPSYPSPIKRPDPSSLGQYTSMASGMERSDAQYLMPSRSSSPLVPSTWPHRPTPIAPPNSSSYNAERKEDDEALKRMNQRDYERLWAQMKDCAVVEDRLTKDRQDI